jgi:adenylate cyclase
MALRRVARPGEALLGTAPTAVAYRFAGFVLDIARGTLLAKNREEIPLRRKTFQLLKLLVENAGQLLDRDTIYRAIWADLVVSDDSITQCIHELRRGLGEGSQSIVRTVPGRGYLMAAQVTTADGLSTAPPVTEVTGLPAAGLASAPRLSVVVLPFDNLGGSDAADYLVDGITDDLTTDLSGLPDFFVIARNCAFTYKGKAVQVTRIGEELGVRYAVAGSVRVDGDRLRINAQLISTETGAHIWANRFYVRRDETQCSVDDIVRQIVLALNARILAAEGERGLRERPNKPDAADILLRARALRSNLAPNPQRWTEVVSLYEHAVELEPCSITALTGLANALIDTTYGNAEDPTAAEKYRRADELITRAELLQPDHVEVMCARVYLLGKQGRYTELIPIAQRGIELHPNRSNFSLWFGTCLMRTGRAEEAIPQLEREIRVSPRNPQIFARYELMGYALAFLGRYDEAIPWLHRSFAAHPNMDAWMSSGILATVAATQALSNHPEEARVSAARACRLRPSLTARSYYRVNTRGPITAAQVARLREGLRLAGIRDHADEDADFGIASDDALHDDYDARTPTTVPGAHTIHTPQLAALVKQRKPLILDTVPWGESLPGAIGLWGAGVGGSVLDEFQHRLRNKMLELTGGRRNLPVVAVGWNAERFQGRNLAQRLVALGYTAVSWYRGGREAWEVAGHPQDGLIMQEW